MFVGSFGAKVLHNFVCAVAVFFAVFVAFVKSCKRFVSFQIAFQLCHPLRFEVQTLFNRKIFFLISFQCGCGQAATDRCHDCRSFVLSKHPHTFFFHFLSLYRRFASVFAPTFPPDSSKIFSTLNIKQILTVQSLSVLFGSRQHKSGFSFQPKA